MKNTELEEQQQTMRVEVVSQLFSVSVRRVQQLTQDGVIKTVVVEGRKREYPFPEVVQKYIQYLQGIAYKHNRSSEKMDEVKLAELDLRRRKLEAQVLTVEGQVHTSSDVERVMGDMINSFKTRMRGIPAELADKLVKAPDRKTIVQIIEEEMDNVSLLLSDYNPDVFYSRNKDYVDMGDETDGGTATPNVGRPEEKEAI